MSLIKLLVISYIFGVSKQESGFWQKQGEKVDKMTKQGLDNFMVFNGNSYVKPRNNFDGNDPYTKPKKDYCDEYFVYRNYYYTKIHDFFFDIAKRFETQDIVDKTFEQFRPYEDKVQLWKFKQLRDIEERKQLRLAKEKLDKEYWDSFENTYSGYYNGVKNFSNEVCCKTKEAVIIAKEAVVMAKEAVVMASEKSIEAYNYVNSQIPSDYKDWDLQKSKYNKDQHYLKSKYDDWDWPKNRYKEWEQMKSHFKDLDQQSNFKDWNQPKGNYKDWVEENVINPIIKKIQ